MKKYIVLALTLLLLAIQGGMTAGAVEKIPSAFFFDKTSELTAEEWLGWKGENLDLVAAPCIRRQTDIDKHPVQTVYTTELCRELAGVPMKYGAFPWQKGQIALSDRLATELFFTDDILGAEVEIGGKTYTICGIYLEDQSLLGRASQSIYEEVFLYLGDFEQQDIKLSEFFVSVGEGQNVANLLADIERMLGVTLQYRELRDLLERNILMRQSCSLARLPLAVTLLAWCILRLAPLAARIIRRDEERTGLMDFLTLGGLSLCLVGSFFLLRWFSFNLTLPQDWLEFQGNIWEYVWQWMKIRNEWKDYFIFRFAENAGQTAVFLGIAAGVLGIYGAAADLWQSYKRRMEL